MKYHFNISHGNQSSVPAKNVTTIWYLPEFLQFERIKNEFEGLVVEKIHGTSNIQVKVRWFICTVASSAKYKRHLVFGWLERKTINLITISFNAR